MSVKMRMPKLTESLSAPLQTDTKPYLLKPVPVGNRELLKLIGGTVAVNQQVPDSNVWANLSATHTYADRTVTITNTGSGLFGCYLSSGNRFSITGHKYLLKATAKVDTATSIAFGLETGRKNFPLVANTETPVFMVQNAQADNNAITLYFFAGTTATVKDVQCIDLTAMFNPTIADYAYTLETGHAGDGIAWLKSYGFFAKDYYPYDAGSLLSVKTSGHVTGGHSYPLSDIELRGIPKLVSGAIEYDGDSYEADGTVTRRYGVVDLGTLTWTYNGTRFSAVLLGVSQRNTREKGVCSKYPVINDSVANAPDKSFIFGTTSQDVYAKDSSYADADAFKTAMNGAYLVYELATPTTETADAYENPQIVETGGTESFIDGRTVEMPVGNISEYCEAVKSVSIGMRMGKGLSVKMRMGGEL